MIFWGCRCNRHGWRECSTPRQGNDLPFKLANQNLNDQWGRKHRPPVLSQSQPGRSQHQLRKAGVFMGPDYHNPNPWVRLLGMANESEIEIDGIISRTLIDSGAMISIMSKEYCDKHGYEIQPLDQLVLIEDSGEVDGPYFGYVKVKK